MSAKAGKEGQRLPTDIRVTELAVAVSMSAPQTTAEVLISKVQSARRFVINCREQAFTQPILKQRPRHSEVSAAAWYFDAEHAQFQQPRLTARKC